MNSPEPGIHLFQRGGLEGRIVTRYGIMSVPHLLVVGPDGKVVQRSVDIGNLDEAVARQLK